jgi:biopolymer transport protein ExbB/TolQ
LNHTEGVDLSPTAPNASGVNFGLSSLWEKPQRSTALILAALAGILFIGVLTVLLSGRAAVLILDHPSLHFFYPFTIQNVMHVIFFVALGELFVRWRIAVREKNFLDAHFLPEDDRTVLVSRDLGPIRRRVANLFDHENGLLPSLINLAILQFQSSSSVEQAAGVMSQQLELMANRLDLRYGLVRFIAWVVPTLGFIGTVYSLGASLSAAGDPNKALDLHEVAKTLGVGFDCTMVALVQSAILVFLLHLVQEREESALNDAGDYTLRNLINRLYAAPEEEKEKE